MTTLMTCWDEKYSELAEVSLPVLQRYCGKHGYALHTFHYHTDPRRLLSFGDRGKIQHYLSLYREGDIIMWLDIDALIMNSKIKIEDRLGCNRFLWTYDKHGPLSGFWIARCDSEVRNFLAESAEVAARSTSLYVYEKSPPDTIHLQVEPHGISDQSAMRQLMSIPPFNIVADDCFPGVEVGHCFEPCGDEYVDYEDGKWIITFPGLPLDERLRKMQEWAKKAK